MRFERFEAGRTERCLSAGGVLSAVSVCSPRHTGLCAFVVLEGFQRQVRLVWGTAVEFFLKEMSSADGVWRTDGPVKET